MQFLMDLNDSYARIRGQILMIKPLPLILKVFNLVVQEERQRSIGSESPSLADSLSFNTLSLAPLLPTPATIIVPFSSGKLRREHQICSHCGIAGHTVNRCYMLHGYPPGYKPKPKPKSEGSQTQMQQTSLQSTSHTTIDSSKQQ